MVNPPNERPSARPDFSSGRCYVASLPRELHSESDTVRLSRACQALPFWIRCMTRYSTSTPLRTGRVLDHPCITLRFTSPRKRGRGCLGVDPCWGTGSPKVQFRPSFDPKIQRWRALHYSACRANREDTDRRTNVLSILGSVVKPSSRVRKTPFYTASCEARAGQAESPSMQPLRAAIPHACCIHPRVKRQSSRKRGDVQLAMKFLRNESRPCSACASLGLTTRTLP